MAVRTTEEAVAAIIELDLETEEGTTSLDPFIETAAALIDELLVDHYSESYLEIIERWLAAHFYAIRYPRTQAESVRGINEKFESYVRLRFDQTRYGQQALVLDYLGILALISEGKSGRITATIAHIGGGDCYCYEEDCTTSSSDDDDSGTGTGT